MKSKIFLFGLFVGLVGCKDLPIPQDSLSRQLSESFTFVQIISEDRQGERVYSLKDNDSGLVQFMIKCETRSVDEYRCTPPVRIR